MLIEYSAEVEQIRRDDINEKKHYVINGILNQINGIDTDLTLEEKTVPVSLTPQQILMIVIGGAMVAVIVTIVIMALRHPAEKGLNDEEIPKSES